MTCFTSTVPTGAARYLPMNLLSRVFSSLLSLAPVLAIGCGEATKSPQEVAPPAPAAVKKHEEYKAARPKGGMTVPPPAPKFFPPDTKPE
jgi:hypothetical protein